MNPTTSYWRNHFDRLVLENKGSPLKQVAKTRFGQEVDGLQIQLILRRTVDALALNKNDWLLDLCCGNGLLSQQLARYVHHAFAVDYSHEMIYSALDCHPAKNIDYVCADVLTLESTVLARCNKVVMYEGLQYMDTDMFARLLDRLRRSGGGQRLFLGGIPDKSRLRRFYRTEEQYRFFQQRERSGRPHMGRWWLQSEIAEIAGDYGFIFYHRSQHPDLYTTDYRFDCILRSVTAAKASP